MKTQGLLLVQYLRNRGVDAYLMADHELTLPTVNDTVVWLYDYPIGDNLTRIEQANTQLRFSTYTDERIVKDSRLTECVSTSKCPASQALDFLTVNHVVTLSDKPTRGDIDTYLLNVFKTLNQYQAYETNSANFTYAIGMYYTLKNLSDTVLERLLESDISILETMVLDTTKRVVHAVKSLYKGARLILVDTIGVAVTLQSEYDNEVAELVRAECARSNLSAISLHVYPVQAMTNIHVKVRVSKDLDATLIASKLASRKSSVQGTTYASSFYFNGTIDAFISYLTENSELLK